MIALHKLFERTKVNKKWKNLNTYVQGRKFWYDTTLIKASKEFPIKSMSINSKLLDTKIYWTLNTFFDLKQHLKRMTDCDLKYPIILSPSGKVIDGYHRIMKVIQMNKTTIKYVKLDKMPPHDFIE